MITLPAMVSSDVVESMVLNLKLLPWIICIERIVSPVVAVLMICCAAV